MTLTLEEVEHIAELARLKISPQEKNRYREQLSEILEYASRLGDVDTSGVDPTSSVLSDRSALRGDEPRSGMGVKALLYNAPDVEKDQFRVPPVLE